MQIRRSKKMMLLLSWVMLCLQENVPDTMHLMLSCQSLLQHCHCVVFFIHLQPTGSKLVSLKTHATVTWPHAVFELYWLEAFEAALTSSAPRRV